MDRMTGRPLPYRPEGLPPARRPIDYTRPLHSDRPTGLISAEDVKPRRIRWETMGKLLTEAERASAFLRQEIKRFFVILFTRNL